MSPIRVTAPASTNHIPARNSRDEPEAIGPATVVEPFEAAPRLIKTSIVPNPFVEPQEVDEHL